MAPAFDSRLAAADHGAAECPAGLVANQPEDMFQILPFPGQPRDSKSEAKCGAANDSVQRQLTFQSAQMSQLVCQAKQFAQSTASVLITGESGTGKELFSRLIHQHSPRRDHKFVPVNCAALPELLTESEFFGHERGAFTGALQQRIGHFELADGGSILLDEVSEIPTAIQAKLLRAIEEREIQRIGGSQPIKVDIRIIATSNRNLAEEVARRRFRLDLYHRLNVVQLEIPPLRKRIEDIPLLVLHFIKMFQAESAAGVNGIDKDAMGRLCKYHWPGNIRELRNVIHRACILANSNCITCDCLPEFQPQQSTVDVTDDLAGLQLAEIERKVIAACLRQFGGNKRAAAQQLGVTARTLSNKLKTYREQGLPCDF